MTIIHYEFAGPSLKLLVGKRYHYFEMHRYCGPMRLRPDGETSHNEHWEENSPFWDEFQKWMDQGQRVDEFGRCVVDS